MELFWNIKEYLNNSDNSTKLKFNYTNQSIHENKLSGQLMLLALLNFLQIEANFLRKTAQLNSLRRNVIT